jgi:predicted RNA-binding Zn ribbon-like protein
VPVISNREVFDRVIAGDRLPPPELASIQAFLNSRDLATGRDDFATPELMKRWLVGQRLVAPQAEFDETEHQHLVEVRDALAALVGAAGDNDGSVRRWVTILNEAARRVRLGVRLHPDEGYRLMAEGMGIDRPVGDLLVRVMGAMAAGVWPRLKVCANPECGRAFYDSSRNHSARWCSMAGCGNRMKGRAYRQRARAGHESRNGDDSRRGEQLAAAS